MVGTDGAINGRLKLRCNQDHVAGLHSSSEEDIHDGEETSPVPDDTVIGVSIGRQQTRLTSPTTPAAEKAAAMEEVGGFFDSVTPENESIPDSGVHVEDESPPSNDVKNASSPTPSPWRVGERDAQRSSFTRIALRDGLLSSRKRSSSGPDSSRDGWHKTLMAGLPSIFSSSNSDRSKSPEVASTENKSKAPSRHTSPPRTAHARPDLKHTRAYPSQLRRSTSETGLHLNRTISRVSSLGDDSRFEHVHQQVNSRLKAIKDSLHDSSLKLPNFSSIPSLSSFAPDFLRERSLSVGRRSTSKASETTDSPERPVDPLTRQPYKHAKAAIADVAADKAHSHPHFQRALKDLDGDVVVLGGYRGSILRSAEHPHRQVWVPVKVGLNLRKVDLEVSLDEDGDETATDKIIPDGMLTHIGPVDISRRLLKRLRNCTNARDGKLRVHDYGYDWRLSPTFLSNQLIKYLESLPCNQPDVSKQDRGAVILAHSLGGLITRHAVNRRPDLFRGVVYAGVPQTCVNILGPLRNGDEVLLSSRVLTAQVNFSIRTSFALLPLDGRCFIDKKTREQYRVDFFDPQTWIDYRLSPCMARPLPPLVTPPKTSTISSYVSSVANALPLPGRKSHPVRPFSPENSQKTTAGGVAEPDMLNTNNHSGAATVAHGNIDRSDEHPKNSAAEVDDDQTTSVSTAVTVSREDALGYLTRTLAEVKQFKQDLAFRSDLNAANLYPPAAVIYGKSTPTVYGARVHGRDGIKHADAYDDLAFASGDGVVLARAAMLPPGYVAVRGGVVSSERGHVTLLGDLEAVGKCLCALGRAHARGVGGGLERSQTS